MLCPRLGEFNIAHALACAMTRRVDAAMRPTLLGLSAVGLLVCLAAGAAEFYVAVDGDDAHPGTLDQPFATPERARDAIRELKQAGPLDAPLTVWIRGGAYFRVKTFELQEEDSGTAKAPITYRGYGDEAVRFIGGQVLDASWFGPVTDAAVRERLDEAVGDQVVEAVLEAHGVTDFGDLGGLAGGLKLFHNARRLPLARWPDAGWAEARSANTVGLDEYAAEALAKERKLGKVLAMRYDGPGPRHWTTLENVWLRGIWQQEYFMEAWHPKGFDPERREITMEFDAFPHLCDWRRFYVANVLEEMDAPGEWYLDREHGRLYLLPPEDFAAAPLYASMLEDTMIALSNVSYVTIRGLTLEVMRGQAVHIGGGTHTRLAGCVIRNARQGVTVSHGTHNGVVGCDIYDLGGMGVHLVGGDRQTLTPAHLYVDNCHIHHYSRLLKNWQPAVKVKGVGNRVSHCWMHDAPQYAVNFEGNDHLFEFNHMHDLCLEMSDVGVIGCGTDWTYRGNVLRYNFVHHIPERPYPGVCGFYFDNCASSGEVFGNVFYKMVKPVMIGGGRDHLIENNIFIECENPVYLDNRGLRWGHFREGGPMYDVLDQLDHDQPPWSTRYPKLARILDEVPQAPLGNVLARNVSVRSGWRDPEAECRKTFANNIDRKYMRIEDNYVTDDDPGFVDMAHMDFQLRDDSVVFEAIPEFRRIRFHQIGIYQDDLRATWPSSPDLQ